VHSDLFRATPSALNNLTKFVQGVFFSPLANHDRLIVGFDATARAKFTLALYSDPNIPSLKIRAL
jgi:hypothetical protein